jgi:hypothetical protein
MPNSHLDHTLGESTLYDALKDWRPASETQRRLLMAELLTHSRACANTLHALSEHRAVTLDANGHCMDIVDPWDVCALSDLLAGLLEVITIVDDRKGTEDSHR